jgi:hypothetical protein
MSVLHGEAATTANMDTHFGALFRGSTRSIVSCHGKPASAMMQPFTAVRLELRGQQDSVAHW